MTSIEELCILGVASRLQSVFKLERPPLEVTASDHVVRAQYVAQMQQSTNLQFPLVFYMLSGFSEGDTYATSAMRYSGWPTASDEDTGGLLDLIPAIFTFNIWYMDDNKARMLAFCSKWMKASTRGDLNFEAIVDGSKISIQCKPTPNLSVPAKQAQTDSVQMYEFTSDLTVRGYISGPFDDSLRKIAIIKEVMVSGLLGSRAASSPHEPYLVPESAIEDYPDLSKRKVAFIISAKE